MSEELAAQLAKSEIFSGLKKEDLAALAAIAAPIQFKKGAEIFAEGDGGDAFYQIVEGTVSITKRDPGGVKREIAVLQENDILGEMALLTNLPRSASAVCRSEARLVRILKSDFDGWLQAGGPQTLRVLFHLVTILCRRLRDMSEKVSELLQKEAAKARPELAALREKLAKEWSF